MEVEITEVKNKSAKKDEKIAFLLENMQEMEERLSQLTESEEGMGNGDTVKALETEVEALKKMVEEKDIKFAKALATAKKLKMLVNETKANLEKVKKEKEGLVKRLQDSEASNEKESVTEEKIEESVQKTTEASPGDMEERERLEKMMADLQSQCQSYAEFCQQLQDQVQTLTESLHEKDVHIKATQDIVEESSVKYHKLEQSFNTQLSLTETLEADISEMRDSIKSQKIALEEKEQMNALLQADLNMNIGAVDILKQELVKSKDSEQELVSKCEQLENELQEKETAIVDLNKSIADADNRPEEQAQFNELLEQNKSYEDTIQMLQQDIKGRATQLAEVEDQYHQVVHDRDMMTRKLQDYSQMYEQNEALSTQIDELSASLENKDSEVDRLQSELTSFKQSSSMSEELMIQLNEKDTKLAHLTQNLEDVIQADNEREEQFKQVKSQFDNQVLEKEHIQRDLRSASEKINELLTEIKAIKVEYSVLDTTERKNKETILNLNEQLSELSIKDSEIQTLTDKITVLEMKAEENEQMEEEIKALSSELQRKDMEMFELKDKVKVLEFEKNDLTCFNESLEQAKRMFEEEKETFDEKLAEMVAHEAVLKGNDAMIRQELDTLVGKNSSLEESKINLEQVVQTLNSSVSSLGEELSVRDQKIRLLSEESEHNMSAIDDSFRSESEDLKLQLESVRKDLEASVAERDGQHTEIQSLQEQNDQLKNAEKKLQTEIESYNAER